MITWPQSQHGKKPVRSHRLPGVDVEVFMSSKLGRIYVNGGDDHIRLLPSSLDQAQMPLMQVSLSRSKVHASH